MGTDRYERERGAWVLSRAGRRPGARRRGEKLMLAARRADRDGVDAGDVAATESVTPGLLHRIIHREEDGMNQTGWAVGALVGAGITAWAVGPALLGGAVIYGAWWYLVPRVGPVRIAPLAVVTALTAGVCGLIVMAMPPTGFWATVTAARHTAWWVGAPGFAAWLTYAWGWAAVKSASSPSTTPVALTERDDDTDDDDDTLTVTPTWFGDNTEIDDEDTDTVEPDVLGNNTKEK